MKLDISEKNYSEKIKVLKTLYSVFDPELGVNIVDLGLIYNIEFSLDGKIKIKMTFSTPNCPLGESIINGVKNSLEIAFPNYFIEVEIVWEPMWSAERISEDGKRQLGIN